MARFSFRVLMPGMLANIGKMYNFGYLPNIFLATQFGYFIEFFFNYLVLPRKMPRMMSEYFMDMLVSILSELCAQLTNHAGVTAIPEGAAFAIAHTLYTSKFRFFEGEYKKNAKLLSEVISLLEKLQMKYMFKPVVNEVLSARGANIPDDFAMTREFQEVINIMKPVLETPEVPEKKRGEVLKIAKQALEKIIATHEALLERPQVISVS